MRKAKENLRKALRKQLDASIAFDEAQNDETITQRQYDSLENKLDKANEKVKWAWKRVIRAAINYGKATRV
jgi:hypothetical protein